METLKNDFLEIKVNSHGAELSSVKSAKTGKEYLWHGDSAFWGRRSPVLFPVVGKYKDLKSIYDGKEYSLPQHGFARDCDFTLIEKNDDFISFELTDSEETLAKYPFRFSLVCSFRLVHNKIIVSWDIKNTDDKDIYFSIGAHPAFNCKKGETVLKMDGKDLEYSILNADGLFVPEKYKVENEFVLTDSVFDRDALILENSGVHSVSLIENGKEFITVNFEADIFGIWSPVKKNAPFVCIEPWYGRADRFDFDYDIKNREWGNKLDVNETFHKEYEIVVNE